MALAVVAGLIVVSYLLGASAAGYLDVGACWGSGGIWSDRFGVCECANYGGNWQGGQCIGVKTP